ncbi:MAG: tetratricopeptide repeat protein [Planctomycetota bacterium]
MLRALTFLGVFCVSAAAQDRYDSIVLESHRIARTAVKGEALELRLRRAVNNLAKAVELDQDRWPAWYWRGIYRTNTAGSIRARMHEFLDSERTLGAAEELLAQHRAAAQEFIDREIQLSGIDFANMARALRKRGSHAREELLLANAMMKFTDRALEKTADGKPGAIADLKKLIQLRINLREVTDTLTRAYMLLAEDKFAVKDYDEAERYWKEALKYAPTYELRHQILGNLVGMYESDNRYEKSEQMLHKQLRLDPSRAETWKNLGLVLGLQSRLREALVCYRRVAELSRERLGNYGFALVHGNAWLRAATIHGTLLEDDGDLLLAWRLLLEYRSVHGDDYNFALAFGGLCFDYDQYALAHVYYEHAKNLRPFCIAPYQRLRELAARLPGTAEERRKRSEAAKIAFEAANDRHVVRNISVRLRRICGGMSETFKSRPRDSEPAILTPDPLAGFNPNNPPPWLAELAAARDPFRPYDPDVDGGTLSTVFATPEEARATTNEPAEAGGDSWLTIGVPVICSVAAGFLLLRRARKSAA